MENWEGLKGLLSYPIIKTPWKKIAVDVAIIGGGPNGLTAGCYLAKSGLKVAIVDRRAELGGGVATEEATCQAGFRHNVHAVYFMMVDYAPLYQDLNLEAYDLKHIHPPLQFAMPFPDGNCLGIYSDLERTQKSIERFSKKDAASYREFFLKSQRMVEEFLAPATYANPLPALEQAPRLESQEWGKELLELSEKSPLGVVDELFEKEEVKTLLLYILCMWGLDPTQSGVGYLIPLYFNRSANYRLVLNGSHNLTQALIKVFLESGGKILAPYGARRIIVEGEEVKGLELDDGPILEAKAILSTLDLHQTFFKLVGEENLPREFSESIRIWMWEHWSLLGVHLALEEPPDFLASRSDPEINRSLIYVLGYETPQDFLAHYEAIGRGEVEGKVGFNCCFPTVHDPTQAPKGRHIGLLSQMAPYELKDGKEKWLKAKFKEEMARHLFEILRQYSPNLTEEKIRAFYVSTPLDVENKYLDMVRGSIKQGAYHPLQMGYLRPNAECSTHRSPIKGLYLGGSSTYPGGTVIFGPGYLAAQAVVEDLGAKRWWPEPEMIKKAKEKGLL